MYKLLKNNNANNKNEPWKKDEYVWVLKYLNLETTHE